MKIKKELIIAAIVFLIGLSLMFVVFKKPIKLGTTDPGAGHIESTDSWWFVKGIRVGSGVSFIDAAGNMVLSGTAYFSGATTLTSLVATTLNLSGAAVFTSTLNVNGLTTLAGLTTTGTTTLGVTPNQVNVASTAMVAATQALPTMCSIQNTDGASRVIDFAFLDLNSGTGVSATPTLTYGVTSSATGLASGATMLYNLPVATSSAEKIVATSTVAVPVIWPNLYYVTLRAAATSTQSGNCKVYYHTF